MKCPKCGYLGFEETQRCRNCGYDFSLAPPAPPPELALRGAAQTLGPLDDLLLVVAATPTPSSEQAIEKGRVLEMPLPLFRSPVPDDEPLIKTASAPRPPLAVRRSTPEVPRARSPQPRPQSLDLLLDPDEASPASERPAFAPSARAAAPRVSAASAPGWPVAGPDAEPEQIEPAAIGLRLVAVLIDLGILALVDLAVVYFTMQICGLSAEDLTVLPKAPLLAFLLVQNGGYLVAFTAGGQTLGKMITGIRVVATESTGPMDLGRAMTRTLIWLVLAVPAGLGFLTLFSRDRRGLHDRCAGTRVVRALREA